MNTQEKLSAELNALNAAFKQSEEYILIQKIQMQSTAVSSADKNRIRESILEVYSKLFMSISLDRNINVIVTCVLSSMQFTSATISQILNMEDSSVRSLKHRLKKKMEPEVFSLFFEPKDEPLKHDTPVHSRTRVPYILGIMGCVVIAALFLIFRSDENEQTVLGYTAKNDAVLDEHRFIRVSENLSDVEYSLKKGYAPEVVALTDLPKRLKREKASRLTIKIDGYDITPYRSLMESLWKVGVKSHITNEEKDVENTYHTDSRMVRVWVQGEDMPYHVRYNDFSWTCQTLEDVLFWVPMLDAHGLCLYPMNDDVPYSILQKIAQSAWTSNNKQVSMILRGEEEGYDCTILPEKRDLVADFPDYTVRQIESQLLSEYHSTEPDVVTIENPLVRVADNRTSLYKIERSGKELRIFTSIVQGRDLWISYDANDVIVADGTTYRCKEIIGMAGCERDIFWSPDYCRFRLCHIFEPLDSDVKEFDLNPDSEKNNWYGVQASAGHNPNEKCMKLEMPYTYAILDKVDSDSQTDALELAAIEYNNDNTMLYFELCLMEPRHVPVFIGDDLTITTKSGSVYNVQKLHGIPMNENFIRHAGYTTSPFRAEFPAITDEIDVVTGTVCGESVTIKGRREPVNTIAE